jgi:hypothetical protein
MLPEVESRYDEAPGDWGQAPFGGWGVNGVSFQFFNKCEGQTFTNTEHEMTKVLKDVSLNFTKSGRT